MDYIPAIVGGFLALFLYKKHLQKNNNKES